MQTYDAVVVGAGHQALVAANRLAAAGWSVIVLERAPVPGGAAISEELTEPGFVHDVFSMNHNLFLASPFFADHGAALERHGLRYARSDQPFANAFPGARALRVHADVERTAQGLADPADADGWRRLDALFDRLAPLLFELYAAPVPSRSTLGSTAQLARDAAARRRDVGELLRVLGATPRGLADRFLATGEAKAALCCWGMHLDFGPDVAGGAMFPFLEVFADQRGGMSIPVGGASRMPEALAGLLRERGGTLRCDAEVTAIETAGPGGRASGVVLAGGERIGATRAVIAGVTPRALSWLLGGRNATLRRRARRYRHGPGTMMVHLALDGPIPWAAGDDLASFAYVHVAPYVDDLAATYRDAVAGRAPAEPLLVVGQPTAVDPSRAPKGKHVAWVQVRALPRGHDDPGYAETVLAKLERYAPGVRDRILGQAVLTPADLERRNPNLVGGDSLAGSMHLRQNFVLRPRTRTPVPGLWLTGAATWPGPGLNALAGDHTASAVLASSTSPSSSALMRRARWRE